MSCDHDYYNRLKWLSELILAHPDSRMKALQKSALREYPVSGTELYRHCMSWRFAFKAADIANEEIEP